MKNQIIASLAIVATLMACNPNKGNEPAKVAFHKGEQVVLTFGAPDGNGNYNVAPRKVDGFVTTNNGALNTLRFQWNAGDQIEVWVGDAHSTFTIIEAESNIGEVGKFDVAKVGKNNSWAKFEGTMPADGETFDVTCGPESAKDVKCGATTIENIPTTQNYHPDGIACNLMRFEKTGCTLKDNSILLEPQWAAFRVGYGVQFTQEQTVSDYITNNGGDEAFTVNNVTGDFEFSAYNSEGNEVFKCDYKCAEPMATTGDGAHVECVIVIPADVEYKGFAITPKEIGNSTITKKSDDQVIATGRFVKPDGHSSLWMDATYKEGTGPSATTHQTTSVTKGTYWDAGVFSLTYIYSLKEELTAN